MLQRHYEEQNENAMRFPVSDLPNKALLMEMLEQEMCIRDSGNDMWDATFFCGSCAVIRRKPLDEIGGIAVETVTEDAHTSLPVSYTHLLPN